MIASMCRYDSVAGVGPIRTATSAARTWGAPRSASEYTATVRRPRSRAALMIRSAISPRLATSRVEMVMSSHPEDAVRRRGDRGVGGSGEAHAEHAAGVDRVDHAVVPQPRGGVVRRALRLVLLPDRGLEVLLLVRGPLTALGLDAVAADRREDGGGLLATHDRDPGVGPHPQEARVVRATAHPVVAGPERAADHHGELGYDGAGDRRDELGAVAGDAAVLVLPADHEAGDVLEEHERDAPLVAQLDEVGALEAGLAEEDAVVRDDPHRVAPDPREATDQRVAVQRLDLVDAGPVDDARDDLAHVVRGPGVGRHHVVEALGVFDRLLGRVLLEDVAGGRARARADPLEG